MQANLTVIRYLGYRPDSRCGTDSRNIKQLWYFLREKAQTKRPRV